jgi:hypothetical protein
MENNTTPQQLLIKMALMAWDTANTRFVKLANGLTDAELAAEIAPGKNTGTYLLGHLIAVSDAMLPLLDLGHPLYPQLQEPFLRNPDKTGQPMPPVTELKTYLTAVNAALAAGMQAFTPAQWLERHTAVPEAEFAAEPHRNKLNIVINRTGHLHYHLGQMALLK